MKGQKTTTVTLSILVINTEELPTRSMDDSQQAQAARTTRSMQFIAEAIRTKQKCPPLPR